MIPTMLLFGVLVGWWWRTALVAGPLVWVVLLLLYGDPALTPLDLLVGVVLGLANTAMGVLAVQALRGLWHLVSERWHRGRRGASGGAAPLRRA